MRHETDEAARARRDAWLPHGWADFFLQIAIWLGFGLAYLVARGLADRGPAEAFGNTRRLVRLERHLGGLVELDVQRLALDAGRGAVHAVNWTYWIAQFLIVGVALLWIYLRRNDAYPFVRNALILTNVLGLAGYVAVPTAPPRVFPELGFVDTLARSEILDHGSPLVKTFANPYAAMPSLHAADALIVGLALAALVRQRPLKLVFALYPVWVWFSLVATANHLWIDVAAGVALAIAGTVVAVSLTARGRCTERPEQDASTSGLRAPRAHG